MGAGSGSGRRVRETVCPAATGTFSRTARSSRRSRSLRLNFWDVFRSLGFIEEGIWAGDVRLHPRSGFDVSTISVGDHVVGLGFGAFGAQMVTREELVAPAPSGFSVTGLATVPSAFVSAALSFELSGLEAGDRVLIHAGSGGVDWQQSNWYKPRVRRSLPPRAHQSRHISDHWAWNTSSTAARQHLEKRSSKLQMERASMWC